MVSLIFDFRREILRRERIQRNINVKFRTGSMLVWIYISHMLKNMGCEVSIQVHPVPNEEPIEQVKPITTKVYPELKRQLSSESCVTVLLEESDSFPCDESDFV